MEFENSMYNILYNTYTLIICTIVFLKFLYNTLYFSLIVDHQDYGCMPPRCDFPFSVRFIQFSSLFSLHGRTIVNVKLDAYRSC